MLKWILFGFGFMCAWLPGFASFAQVFDDLALDQRPDIPWHITADEVSYDQQAERYIAKGNAEITKLNRRLSADFVSFDHKTMRAEASGNVVVVVGKDVMVGRRLVMDLEKQVGTLEKGTVFLSENHFFIRGDRIEKVGPESYSAENASLTSCDGERPAWKITARKLDVSVEGWGRIRHATLWTRHGPVFYTPYFLFPAKRERQSGFLLPEIAFSSRRGEEYIQPFFWAISENTDATFFAHHMGERGEKLGMEYRYVLDQISKGTFMFDFFEDRKLDDGSPEASDDYGYTDDNFVRTNSDRYWLRGKADQQLPLGFLAQLDLDVASDQDYLNEFRSGYTGFTEADEYFINEFGRALDPYDDTVRSNRLNISRVGYRYSINTGVRWEDNVIARRDAGRISTQSDGTQVVTFNEIADTTVQRMPFFEFDMSRQSFPNTPFYFTLDSEYAHLYRQEGTTGQRADIHPRLLYPFGFKNYISLEPSVGVRHTHWYVDPSAEGGVFAPDGKAFQRHLYDLKLDISTQVQRIFKTRIAGTDGIKHSIRPQVVYEFIPDRDQSELPRFDSLDRIDRKNLITYSITNTFVSRRLKRRVPGAAGAQEASQTPDEYAYRQFCRLKLEQAYDINEANETDPARFANRQDRRPFGPIKAELDLTPAQYLWMKADTEWSTYDQSFNERNVALKLWHPRGDFLSGEYRFDRDRTETILANAGLAVTNRMMVYGYYERNLLLDRRLKSGGGLSYRSQCWTLEAGYEDEEGDHRIGFLINLHGLGNIGGLPYSFEDLR